MSKGHVYILTNPDYPDHVKIGSTTLSPQERCEQISSQTGVLSPFQVHYFVEVSDCEKVERLVHQELKDFRDSKEFFKIDREQAQKTLNEFKQKYPTNLDAESVNLNLSQISTFQTNVSGINSYCLGNNEGEVLIIGDSINFTNFIKGEDSPSERQEKSQKDPEERVSSIFRNNRGFVLQQYKSDNKRISPPILMHGKVNCFKKGPPSHGKNLRVKDKYERRERFVDFKFSKDDRYLLGYTDHNEYFMWGITNTLLKGSMKPIFSRECDLIKSFDIYNDEMIFLIQTSKKLEARSCKDDSIIWEIYDFPMSSISFHQKLNNIWCTSETGTSIVDESGGIKVRSSEIVGEQIITHPYLPISIIKQNYNYIYVNDSLEPLSDFQIESVEDLSITPEGKYICWLNEGVFQYSEISIDILN